MRKTLVIYYSDTGTTKAMAEKIAAHLDADLAVVHPKQPYTTADLNWHDAKSRTSIEQHTSQSRVAIVDDLPSLADYDNVVIGHPIWWAIPPRIFASLIDQLDLNGKHVAFFATSGGSGYTRCQSFFERTIQENGYTAVVNQGAVLHNDQEIATWLARQDLA